MVVGDLTSAVDVLVIGGGPGGYVAALRAAQLGQIVALVDPRRPGGACLRDACIPAKALLTAANRYHSLADLPAMGIDAGPARADLTRMQAWKQGIVDRLADGVSGLLAAREVEVVTGAARFTAPREVRVALANGSHRISFEQCVVATGATPVPLPGLRFDGARVLTPAEALRLDAMPPELAVVGANGVAVEMATLFAKLGSRVRLLLPTGSTLLSDFDPLAGRLVGARLRRLGVTVERDVTDPASAVAEVERVVVAVSVSGATAELDLAAAGLHAGETGFLAVDSRQRTANPAIYAVGDVTGGPALASVALRQAKVAAETIAGRHAQYAPQAVPRAIWSDPEVAAVGLTAAEAQAAGYVIVTGRFPFAANGRALTLGAPDGATLVVAEADSGVLLGVTSVGPGAADLIGEAALALEMGATLTDLAETQHPHPALGETLMEAAEAALGIAVHIR